MRFSSGGRLSYLGTTTAPATVANGAPSAVTDGGSTALGGITGRVADEWYVRMRVPAGYTTTTITFRPHLLVQSVWDAGTLYTLKVTSDAGGGRSALLPGVGAATQLYLELVSIDGGTPGVVLEAFHNEHGEQQ